MLDQMPDVHVTLFVTEPCLLIKAKPGFCCAFAKAGHELGNHTSTHARLTETGNLSSEVTLVYPNHKDIGSVVGSDHFCHSILCFQ